MTQLSLENWTPPQAAPSACEQSKQLVRVESRLATTILQWLEFRLHADAPTFHAADLCEFVSTNCGGSPESAMRILRQLRKSGHAHVDLLSRSESKYQIVGVRA